MIASYMGAVFIIIGFSVLFVKLRLTEKAKQIQGVASQSMATLSNSTLSDDDKEAAMRRDSKALFMLFVTLTAGLAVALGLPLLLVWLVGWTHVWTFDRVIEASLSWPLIVGGTFVFIVILLRPGRSGRK
ncbi:MAG: hypothetical protein ABI395_04950 [Sphingobium sp.]